MTPLVGHLLHFARDQLAVLPGWQGEHYVQKCLLLWEQEYGSGIAEEVRRTLGNDLNRRGRR